MGEGHDTEKNYWLAFWISSNKLNNMYLGESTRYSPKHEMANSKT